MYPVSKIKTDNSLVGRTDISQKRKPHDCGTKREMLNFISNQRQANWDHSENIWHPTLSNWQCQENVSKGELIYCWFVLTATTTWTNNFYFTVEYLMFFMAQQLYCLITTQKISFYGYPRTHVEDVHRSSIHNYKTLEILQCLLTEKWTKNHSTVTQWNTMQQENPWDHFDQS